MIIIFDLDETLYNEKNFVKSGFQKVAYFLEKNYNLNLNITNKFLLDTYNLKGRKKIFNKLLIKNKLYSKSLLVKLIYVYRNHKPNIKMSKSNLLFLETLSNKFKLYLVTDGNKIVQKNKIKALKISRFFKRIFITHQYGIKHSKPSLYCFARIKKLENCIWKDLIYIGDDPNKDFINLNKKGCITIRLMQGKFASTKVKKNYDAMYKINKLNDFNKLYLKYLYENKKN